MKHIAKPNFGRPSMRLCVSFDDAGAGGSDAGSIAKITDFFVTHCLSKPATFSYYHSKEETVCRILTVEEFVQIVKVGDLIAKNGHTVAENTALARSHYPQTDADGNQTGSRKMYDIYKSLSPAIGVAAVFNAEGGHKQKNIAYLTGLLMYDFDHLKSAEEARALAKTLSGDPTAFAVWITASGHGVRLLVRYLPDATARAVLSEQAPAPEQWIKDYKTIWLYGQAIIEARTGYRVDPATKDPTRLSYLSHDAEAHFDLSPHTEENSLLIPLEVLRPAPPAHSYKAQKEQKNPASYTNDPHTLASRMLQKRGLSYHLGNRNNYAYQYSCLMLRLGATEESCRRQIALMSPALDDKEIDALVASAAGSVQGDGESSCLKHLLEPGKKSNKASDMQTVIDHINERYEVRFNKQSGQVEMCEKALAKDPNPLMRPFQAVNEQSRIITNLWVEIRQQHGIDFAPHKLMDLMRSEAVSYEYDPIPKAVRYCIEMVKKDFEHRPPEQWHTNDAYRREDKSLIAVPWSSDEDELVRLFGAIDSTMPPALLHWIGSRWMVGMMATALNPTRKGHIMLVLQGTGGTGKTNFFKSLALPQAEATDSLFATTNIGSFANHHNIRESLLQLGCKLMVVLDDIPEMKQSSIDMLKTWTTSNTISYRPIYTTHLTEIERRCTLCGTTNAGQLTNDNMAERRRIVGVHVNSIAHNGLLEKLPLNHIRLYGQAAWLYEQGMQHWLTPNEADAEEQQLHDYTDQFAEEPVVNQLLRSFFFPHDATPAPCDPDNGMPLSPQFMKSADIYSRITARITKVPNDVTPRTIAQALMEMGYKQHRHKNTRGFILIEKPYNAHREEAEQAARQCMNEQPQKEGGRA